MHALGAASLVKATSLEDADIGLYDYVVMEDREKGQRPSAALKASRRLCNVTWLKQCLVGTRVNEWSPLTEV